MKIPALTAAAGLLSACAALANGDGATPTRPETVLPGEPQAEAPEPETADTCGAGAYAGYVGQPRSAVEALTFERPVRIIAPDDMVTMDYREERLNFKLDARGLVATIDCG